LSATLALAGCGDDAEGSGDGDNNNGGTNTGNTGTNAGNNNGSTGGADAGPTTMIEGAGAACNSNSDCKGVGATCATTIGGFSVFGQTIGGAEAPDGYCTGDCTEDGQCGKGGVCYGSFATLGVAGKCHAACTSNSNCRDKYECNPGTSGDAGVAIPGVELPASCLPKPETVQIAGPEIGDACMDDAACNGGTCQLGGQFPGGYCGGACTDDNQCGTNGVCVIPAGTLGTCYEGCAVEADCTREGYTCRVSRLLGSDLTFCLPEQPGRPDGGM
jgi:hypothetical protein